MLNARTAISSYYFAILLSNELLHHMNFLHATIKQKGDLYGAEDYGGTKADATGSGGRIAPGA